MAKVTSSDFRKIINDHWNEALSDFPHLKKPELDSKGARIFGRIEIIDEEGIFWDIYEVKIIIPLNYPLNLPELVEIGGKIDRSPDWHVNPDIESTCCLGPRVKNISQMSGDVSLKRWLQILVIPFLANHTFKVKTGSYAAGEYSHGNEGIMEYYRAEWNAEDFQIIDRLKRITRLIKTGRNERCFCGSGIKFKYCHLESKKHFNGVPISEYRKDLNNLLGEVF